MFNFFEKKKQPELKELNHEIDKEDIPAIIIAGIITLVIPTILIVSVIFGLIYLFFT
ncbi:hypothetical protein J7S27_00785 [Carnobacteriaceae bacterium zg-C25]|nr:hypothetical protein [Carnobacteriaceae bacterium zg-ZUI240]QTU83092.1 hypothetical protein J7S27_00785 [Carnobacteriaceae bacterium zg-C25]